MTLEEKFEKLEKNRKEIEEKLKKLKTEIEYEKIHRLGEPISRYDLLDKINEYDNPHDIQRYIILLTVREIIKKMPCLDAEKEKTAEWILCEDRLPEECEWVLLYAERNAYDDGDFVGKKRVIDIGWQIGGKWHLDGCSGVVGIAWQTLPKPPKAEEGRKESYEHQ